MADKLPERSSRGDIDAFLRKVAATTPRPGQAARGRLIFAMDATASRQPSWDQAAHIQAQMFTETAGLGGLDVQLCHYRGFNEFHASAWLADSEQLLLQMNAVSCAAGRTHIAQVLGHALKQARARRVNALVFVGDSMEEDPAELARLAGELGLLGLPAFVFQEGHDPVAEQCFRQIAKLSGGAWCRFDATSAQQLRDLLSAVAVYAAGGRQALADFSRQRGGKTLLLPGQMERD